jgi:hypothetical protein
MTPANPDPSKDARPPYPHEIVEAHRENDRRELAAILAAAGFQEATFSRALTTAAPGFAVRFDGPHFERTGQERLHISLELRYSQDYDADRDAGSLRDWAQAIEQAGGWSVEYTPGYPRGVITAVRRAR